jgi:hypothetical protein
MRPTQLPLPQNGTHLPELQDAPVGQVPMPAPQVHLPETASHVLVAPTSVWQSAVVVHSGVQQPGFVAQIVATHESQLASSAEPDLHGSCKQAPAYVSWQQVGFASQIFCTQGLHVEKSPVPAAHGWCAHAPPEGLSQN